MPDGDTPALRPPAVPACPLCQAPLAAVSYDDHLRISHRLYRYRDVHRSPDDTLAALLADLVTPKPDPAAWQLLLRLARAEHEHDADRFVTAQLTKALRRVGDDRREAVFTALALVVASGNLPLITILAYSRSRTARQFALDCLAHYPPPYDRHVRKVYKHLLADATLPPEARTKVLALALPNLDAKPASKLLSGLLQSLSTKRALDAVEALERRAGPSPLLDRKRERCHDRLRMTCPRCGVECRRKEMVAHLWASHRLLLDGARVRDPWGVVQDWLDAARKDRDPTWIDRCRIAVEKIDPQRGKAQLDRLLLSRGQADLTTRRAFFDDARDQHAGTCPACFALVPVPPEEPPLDVKLWTDRLVAGGYRVTIDETGPRPWVVVATPTAVVYQGMEPDHPWTPRGAAFLYAGIVVLVALLCAMLWPSPLGSPVLPVSLLLFAATMLHVGIRLAMRSTMGLEERLLAACWRLLVPELHSGGFKLSDSAFAAGLVAWYSKRGRRDVPEADLGELIRLTEAAVLAGQAPAGHLAILIRAQIEQAADDDDDPVPLVVRHLGRCFQGKLPLSFAQQLLESWTAEWWTPINLARLRILVCDRAFEAGYEVQTLLDAGQNAPALGTVLNCQARRSLAALRLIWSWRATRPWDRLGEVATAFELAADPVRAESLAEHPDLLLYQEDRRTHIVADGGRDRFAPARIQVTLAGVWLQEIVFSVPPRVFEVRKRSMGTELILGRQFFRSQSDLDPLSRRLEKWFRWTFHEVLPQVDRVLEWQSPHRAALLRAWGAVPCPGCGQYLLPRVGEVGIAVEEKAAGERGA